MSGTVGERAARSSVILLVRRLLGYAIRFSVIAVLARHLDVKDFGIVAIATTCIGIMTVFGDAGINTWVIYDREDGWEQRTRSAWWLNTFLTLGQCTVAAALLPIAVWLYDEPRLVPVLGILIVTFLVDQLRVVPDAVLQRRMEFRTLAARDLAYDAATGITGVVMALSGWGLWSLVVPRLVLSPFALAMSFRLARWTPGSELGKRDWRRIIDYSKHLIGSDLLHTISNDTDTMIVGKLLGQAAVAFYNTAYLLANLIGRNVTSVLVQVSTPALAKMKEAQGDLGPVCLRMYRVIALVTTPLLAGMFAVADDLVLLVYGPKWVAVTVILRVFTIFTLVRSITSPSGAVFNVIGRTDMTLRMYLVLTPLILAGMIAGSFFGVLGIAVGVTIVRVFVGFLSYSISLHLVGARVTEGFKTLIPSALAAAAMAALVWLARVELGGLGVPLGIRLIVTVPLGAVMYLVFLRLVSRAAFAELFGTVSKISPKLKRVVGRFVRMPAAT